MKYVDVMKYCLSLEGVTRKKISPSGDAFAFAVEENVFAYFETGAPVAWRFSLLVSDEDYENLFNPPKIIRAKDKPEGNWMTIGRVEAMEDAPLLRLINWSHQQAISTAKMAS